jgi:hypothetical protein
VSSKVLENLEASYELSQCFQLLYLEQQGQAQRQLLLNGDPRKYGKLQHAAALE